jgi:hypothetical protein
MNNRERWAMILLIVYTMFYLYTGLVAFLEHLYIHAAIRAAYVSIAVWCIRGINHAVEHREDVFQKWKAEYQRRHFVG